MYEFFTEMARQSLKNANSEAVRHGHSYIGSLHIIAGLLDAAPELEAILASVPVDVDRLRRTTNNAIETLPNGGANQPGAARCAIEQAIRYHRLFRGKEIGPMHVLLGTLTQPDDSVAALFREADARIDDVRAELESRLKQAEPASWNAREIQAQMTDRARKVMEGANEVRRELRESLVGPEHLLHALSVEESGIAGHVLRSLDVTDSEIRQFLHRFPYVETTSSEVDPNLSTSLEQVLIWAHRELVPLGHFYVGTEHLLLALTRLADGRCRDILDALGLVAAELRNEVYSILGYTEQCDGSETIE